MDPVLEGEANEEAEQLEQDSRGEDGARNGGSGHRR